MEAGLRSTAVDELPCVLRAVTTGSRHPTLTSNPDPDHRPVAPTVGLAYAPDVEPLHVAVARSTEPVG